MNSRKILTCNICNLPQDIFRVIFQFLSLKDLMKGEKVFLNNRELLSLYRSSLAGFTIKEEITNEDEDDDEMDELISWIIDHKLLVETLELWNLNDLKMELLNQIRSSLKSLHFSYVDPDTSVPVIPPLGHFPLLTSVTFHSSQSFKKDKLLSFFSHNPQLESVDLEQMSHLSNKILTHLSNSCPKVRILSLCWNNWVNDETMSLLTQQRLFPNLKSLNIRHTNVTNEGSLRQFILSHPLLCGLLLSYHIHYSTEFLVFYLRQVIFPSILSQNNNNDLESHSLAISSLSDLVREGIVDKRNDVVNPEIFSVDILSHFYHKDCSLDTLYYPVQLFCHLSMFPSMIDSILQSQFIPFLLNQMRPHNYLPFHDFEVLMVRCGAIHDHFPLLVEKYRTHPSSLIQIFHRAIEDHFTLMTTEELQAMIPIVLNISPRKDSYDECLKIILKLLREPSSQLLVDPNDLLLSFKSIDFRSYSNIGSLFDCLERFISVNENYQQLLIESNLIPRIMTMVDPYKLINFTNHCLLSSEYELLVDHLVNSGVFQYLLSKHSQFSTSKKSLMASIFEVLIGFKNNKYFEIVREMDLTDELRVKLFEKREGEGEGESLN